MAHELVALGCQLKSAPPEVSPAADKLFTLYLVLLDLLQMGRVTPFGCCRHHVICAVACSDHQTCAQRLLCSCASQREEPPNITQDLSSVVDTEMWVFLGLLPLIRARLDRPFLPLITASDASPSFGSGASVASVLSSVASRLGKLAERRCDFVRQHKEERDDPEIDRLGTRIDYNFQRAISPTFSATRRFARTSQAAWG